MTCFFTLRDSFQINIEALFRIFGCFSSALSIIKHPVLNERPPLSYQKYWGTKSTEVPKVLKHPGCSWNQIIVVCKTSTLFFVHFLRLTRRICRTIKSSLSMRSPPTLSWPKSLIQGCYCWEKLDAYQCQCSPPFSTASISFSSW